MGPEDEVLGRIRGWLEGQESVRAALLTGSRAVEGSRVDELSDYDVLLFLAPGSRLLEGDGWVEELGEVLVMLPEEGAILDRCFPTRLVQYPEGLRIDFGLAPVELLEELGQEGARLPASLDAGYRVLLDRDGTAGGLPEPGGRGHLAEPPTEEKFRELVREFWWETLCVARHLARGEVLPARYSQEVVIRYRCLIPVLEWRVGVERDWKVAVGVNGRGLPDLLTPEDRRDLAASMPGSGVDEGWAALGAALDLFRRSGRGVGRALGYPYPEEQDREVTARIRKIREAGDTGLSWPLESETRNRVRALIRTSDLQDRVQELRDKGRRHRNRGIMATGVAAFFFALGWTEVGESAYALGSLAGMVAIVIWSVFYQVRLLSGSAEERLERVREEAGLEDPSGPPGAGGTG